MNIMWQIMISRRWISPSQTQIMRGIFFYLLGAIALFMNVSTLQRSKASWTLILVYRRQDRQIDKIKFVESQMNTHRVHWRSIQCFHKRKFLWIFAFIEENKKKIKKKYWNDWPRIRNKWKSMHEWNYDGLFVCFIFFFLYYCIFQIKLNSNSEETKKTILVEYV